MVRMRKNPDIITNRSGRRVTGGETDENILLRLPDIGNLGQTTKGEIW